MVRKIAKAIIRISIYPTQDKLRSLAEEFISDNYPEIHGKVKKKWTKIYEKEIYSEVRNLVTRFRNYFSLIKSLKTAIGTTPKFTGIVNFTNKKIDFSSLRRKRPTPN